MFNGAPVPANIKLPGGVDQHLTGHNQQTDQLQAHEMWYTARAKQSHQALTGFLIHDPRNPCHVKSMDQCLHPSIHPFSSAYPGPGHRDTQTSLTQDTSPISKGAPRNPAEETYFGSLYPGCYSFSHYPKFMTIGEGTNID